jgi:hypothetical protein
MSTMDQQGSALVEEAEARAGAAIVDAALARALVAVREVSDRATDANGAGAVVASVLALMYSLAEDVVPSAPTGVPIVDVCATLANDPEFVVIAATALDDALSTFEAFVSAQQAAGVSGAKRAAYEPYVVEGGGGGGRTIKRSKTLPLLGMTNALFEDAAAVVVSTGALTMQQAAQLARTLAQLASLTSLPLGALLPFVMGTASLVDAHQTWQATDSRLSTAERIKRNAPGIVALLSTMVYVGASFPLASNAPTWTEFFTQPLWNALDPVYNWGEGNWAKWHPAATKLLPIVTKMKEEFPNEPWRRLRKTKTLLGLPNAGGFCRDHAQWLSWLTSNIVPGEDMNTTLFNWMEMVRTRKGIFGGNFYTELQHMQTTAVALAVGSTLIGRLPSMRQELARAGEHSDDDVKTFVMEARKLRRELNGVGNGVDDQEVNAFQKRINLAARRIVLDLATGRNADHAALREAMRVLIKIRADVLDNKPPGARRKVKEQEGALADVEREIRINEPPPERTRLSRVDANAFYAELEKDQRALNAIAIDGAQRGVVELINEVARKIMRAAGGRRADHDFLTETMAELISIRRAYADQLMNQSPPQLPDRRRPQAAPTQRLKRLSRRLDEEPAPDTAAAYGADGRVVAALFERHVGV